MPILIFLATVLGGAAFWFWRARDTADAARGAIEMGRDVVGAARQWTFKRRTDVHPVDAIDDPAVAEGALTTMLYELGHLPTREDREAMLLALQSRLETSRAEAEELATLGHWFGRQCGDPSAAVSRLSRRLARIGGPLAADEMADLAEMAIRGEPSDAQADALAEMARRLGR